MKVITAKPSGGIGIHNRPEIDISIKTIMTIIKLNN